MDVHNKNVQNIANEYETCKSGNTNEEESAECIFCQETCLNSTSGERWARRTLC
jgi:hypothetical protein